MRGNCRGSIEGAMETDRATKSEEQNAPREVEPVGLTTLLEFAFDSDCGPRVSDPSSLSPDEFHVAHHGRRHRIFRRIFSCGDSDALAALRARVAGARLEPDENARGDAPGG